MKSVSLEELTRLISANPCAKDELFKYHAGNGMYGLEIKTAIEAMRRNHARKVYKVQNARAWFEIAMANEMTAQKLIGEYLPAYNAEIAETNRKGWQRGRNVALGMAAAGLCSLAYSCIADAEIARKAGKAATLAFEAGALICLLKSYLAFKSCRKI